MTYNVYRIKSDATQELIAQYSDNFSGFAHIVHHWIQHNASCDFFNLVTRRKAEAQIKIGKSGRTAFYEESNGDVIMIIAPKGVGIHDGKGLETKFDFEPLYYKLIKK